MSTAPASGPGRDVVLVASGDSRLSANRVCWPAQAALETAVTPHLRVDSGARVVRGHPFDAAKGHGFIDGQARGIEIFRTIDPRRAARRRRGGVAVHEPRPRRTHQAPRPDPHARQLERPVAGTRRPAQPERVAHQGRHPLQHDLERGLHRRVRAQRDRGVARRRAHRPRHVARPPDRSTRTFAARRSRSIVARGADLGAALQHDQAILGVFDEGCMGMYNAIIPDHLLHATGLFKERLSQSRSTPRCASVPDETARRTTTGCAGAGMTFAARRATRPPSSPSARCSRASRCTTPPCASPTTSAAPRSASSTSRGSRTACVASDLAEGLLNNPDRPPVAGADGAPLFDGLAVPHFNEVDECAGVDGLITDRVWTDLGIDPVDHAARRALGRAR